jgi:hypothetical protein
MVTGEISAEVILVDVEKRNAFQLGKDAAKAIRSVGSTDQLIEIFFSRTLTASGIYFLVRVSSILAMSKAASAASVGKLSSNTRTLDVENLQGRPTGKLKNVICQHI